MSSEQPQIITIKKINLRRKTLAISYTKGGTASFAIDEPDNPIPEFGKAFDGLLFLVPIILHLPENWTENCRVTGLVMDTLGGAPTVSLIGKKSLDDAGKEFVFRTPPRLMCHPTEEGAYTPPLTLAQAALVEEAIEQAKQYIWGNRAQGEIVFEDPKSANAEPVEGNELPLEEQEKPKKRRSKKSVALPEEALEV